MTDEEQPTLEKTRKLEPSEEALNAYNSLSKEVRDVMPLEQFIKDYLAARSNRD